MIESVTESFCERCGTRYEFQVPVVEKKRRGLGLNVLLGGRNGAEVKPVAQAALDPFLTVFRFCLECRQYTCPPCWNDEAGFCASCVPFPDAPPAGPPQVLEVIEEPPVEHVAVGPDAWPTADLAEPVAEVTDAAHEAEPVVAEQPVVTEQPAAVEAPVAVEQPVVLERPVVAPPAAATSAPDDAVPPPVVQTESDVALTVAWNQLLLGPTPADLEASQAEPPSDWASLFEESAAVIEPEPEPEPEPVALIEPEPEREPEPEAEPAPAPVVVVEPEPEAEPAPAPVAVVEPEPEPAPVAAAWSITAPDSDAATTPPVWPPLAPVYQPPPSTTPAARPFGMDAPPITAVPPSPQARAAPLVQPEPQPQPQQQRSITSLLARPLGGSQGPQAGAPRSATGVRPCGSCRLPLSANARFCRRCGTSQT